MLPNCVCHTCYLLVKKLLHWLIKLKQSDGSATKSLRMKTEMRRRGTGTGIHFLSGHTPGARRRASRPAMATAVSTTAGSRRTRSVRSRTRLRLPGSSSRRSRRKSTEARALHEAAVAVVHGVRRRAVGERRRMVLRERRAPTRCAVRGRV